MIQVLKDSLAEEIKVRLVRARELGLVQHGHEGARFGRVVRLCGARGLRVSSLFLCTISCRDKSGIRN